VSDESQDLGERIRRIINGLAGELTGDEARSMLDTAARSLGGTLERWGRNPSLRRFIGGVQRDVITGTGEDVELSANLGVSARLGTIARFYIDDAVAAEVPIGDGSEVRVVVSAPSPGLHRVGVKVCNETGEVISDLLGYRLLQVASGRPVVLVDADLVLISPREVPPSAVPPIDALRVLIDEGFELVYFDVHEKNRDSLIQDAVRKQRLPPAAVITYSALEQELRGLEVDFIDMLATSAIRRLRGRGVPVTTILTAESSDSTQSRAEHVAVMSPHEATQRALAGFTAELEQAAELVRARARSNPLDWRLDQTTGSKLIPGNAFRAELDNEKARRRLFEALDAAKSTIHVQLYIVRPSDFTERLIVKLIQRARAGVFVRFMVDALYSDEEVLGRVNPLIQSLRQEANIEALAVHPIATSKEVGMSSLKKRDHRKLTIVDGTHAFVSGRNASDEYYTGFDEVPIHDNTPHDRIPWLDAHVEITGPLVSHVQRTFMHTWSHHGGAPIEHDDRVLPSLVPTGSASGRLVVHRGLADTNGLDMYESMFDAARHHVYIVNDFPIVPALEQALYRVLARGVTVRLLTGSAATRRDDGTFFPAPMHRTLFEFMVKAKLEPLLRAGVEIYELAPPPTPNVVARGGRFRPYVHAKIVSIDGSVTSIGSANLDATASFWESEANVVVQDPGFAAGVEANLQKLIDGSVPLDPDSEYWKRERAQRAVVGTLWPGAFYS
jgi:phosphatidylserine/phosphatidylglycerophosphate/cardiolipin synthase-like enzyme